MSTVPPIRMLLPRPVVCCHCPLPSTLSVLPATGRGRGVPAKDSKLGANEPVDTMPLDSDPDVGVRGPGVCAWAAVGARPAVGCVV